MDWTAERIAELRQLTLQAIEANAIAGDSAGSMVAANDAWDVFRGALMPESVLSLLDALEEAREDLRICREVSEELGGAGFQIRER